MQAEAYADEENQVRLRWWVNRYALWQAMQRDGRYLLATNDWALSPSLAVPTRCSLQGTSSLWLYHRQGHSRLWHKPGPSGRVRCAQEQAKNQPHSRN